MIRMNRRRFSSLALAAPLASSPAFAQATKTVKIGGSIPFSGMQANTGLNVHEGYRVAIKYVNEQLGGFKVGNDMCKLELQMIDDASDPQRAVTLLQKQVDEGTTFFLGSFSSQILVPTTAIVERAKRLMVHCGGAADVIFTEQNKYTFCMFPRASRQFASYIGMLDKMRPAVQTVVIIHANDPFGIAQAAGATGAIASSGLKLIDTHKLPTSVTDVSGVLSSVRRATPDVLIIVTPQETSQLIVQQMVASDTMAKMIYMPLGPEVDAFRKSLGKYSNELMYVNYWDARAKFADPVFGDSQKYYRYWLDNTTRGWSSQSVAASACIVAYVQAMKTAGSLDPEKVRDAVAALDISTLYGRIKWGPQGDGDPIVMGPKVGQVLDGVQEVVFPADAATKALKFPMTPWAKRT